MYQNNHRDNFSRRIKSQNTTRHASKDNTLTLPSQHVAFKPNRELVSQKVYDEDEDEDGGEEEEMDDDEDDNDDDNL